MNRKHKGSRRMDTTALVLVAVAVILLAIAFWQGRDLPLAGLIRGRAKWLRTLSSAE